MPASHNSEPSVNTNFKQQIDPDLITLSRLNFLLYPFHSMDAASLQLIGIYPVTHDARGASLYSKFAVGNALTFYILSKLR